MSCAETTSSTSKQQLTQVDMSRKLLQTRLKQLRNKKLSPSLKKKNANRVSKHHPKNQAKRDAQKPSTTVDASDLKWKPVEVPDTLDDFGGFYGLEEIDGVDVKVVNGKVQFIATGKSKIEKNPGEKKDGIDVDGDAQMEDVVEFKNLDDIKDGELSAPSSSSEDESDDEEKPGPDDKGGSDDDDMAGSEAEAEADSDADSDGAGDNSIDGDELETNVFNPDIDISNIEPPVLPEWTEAMDLSFTTLQGLSQLGFLRPTEIQAKTIPLALQNEDIMGKASTGSGKTLAYGIPILETLVKDRTASERPVGLIFTPTRELAHQVTQHLQKVAGAIYEKNQYSIISLTGGLSIQKQERLLGYKGSARIVVATPGRFLELIEKSKEFIKRFSQIDTLVLDEADRLLQDGHFDEFEKILKHLGRARNVKGGSKSDGWQTMVFSATFSLELFNKLSTASWKSLKKAAGEDDNEMEAVLKHLMTKIHFKSKPVIIDTNPEQKVTSQVRESLIECLPTERDLYVYYFVSMYPGTTLVFCNAIDSVKKLNNYLNNLKISSFQIHSSMSQKNRLKNLEKFQQQAHNNDFLNKPTVLLASDVAARGLDIPGIKHVIHYHLPRSADVYIHRSGRTARADSEGVSVMICSPQEAMGPLRKLRKVLSNKSDVRKGRKWQKDVDLLPVEPDIVSQLRERSVLASELADDELATKSLSKDDNWLKKAAEDLGVDFDSEEDNKDVYLARNKTKKINKTLGKQEARNMRHELNELLSKPLRKDLRRSYLTGGLVNLADSLVKNKGHHNIIGHDKVDALDVLKQKNKGRKR